MANLPLRALTLYKQGIGFFERRGVIEGSSVSLTVPRDAINDVLKSLNAVVFAGGPLASIDYETPAEKEAVLTDLAVRLGDRSSMVDLLSALRGSIVSLTLQDGRVLQGRVLGVESSIDQRVQPPSVLLEADSRVHVITLKDVLSFTLDDARAAEDVTFFLDVSRTEQDRTILTLRMSPGAHDIGISYLAPCPTWRVSYRLVSEQPGQGRLQAWGLFENTLDSDLEDVRLTLMSGRPVSFVYELYATRTPARPHVADDPTALEQAAAHPLVAESLSTITHELRTPLTSIAGFADLLGREMVGPLNEKQHEMLRALRQSSQRMQSLLNDLLGFVRLRNEPGAVSAQIYHAGPLGDLKASGSYFLPMDVGNAEVSSLTYEVSTPVSVRRGQSALVPLLDTSIPYTALCVYNGAKMPNHPLLVWQFTNSTGVALEQGPITVMDSNTYRGEGLMRFTGVGDDVHIPFALEFGILVSEQSESREPVPTAVTFDGRRRQTLVTYADLTDYRYHLRSRVDRPITVLIERRDPRQGEYVEMPVAVFAAEGHSRWPVAVPAQDEAHFTVVEKVLRTSFEDVTTWNAERVAMLRAADALPELATTAVTEIIALVAQRAADQAEQTLLQTEYLQIGERQDQLRKNLQALGGSEREEAIRLRTLDDLEESENRRRAIERALGELSQRGRAREQTIQQQLDRLYQ